MKVQLHSNILHFKYTETLLNSFREQLVPLFLCPFNFPVTGNVTLVTLNNLLSKVEKQKKRSLKEKK